jgi:hypothetical protein
MEELSPHPGTRYGRCCRTLIGGMCFGERSYTWRQQSWTTDAELLKLETGRAAFLRRFTLVVVKGSRGNHDVMLEQRCPWIRAHEERVALAIHLWPELKINTESREPGQSWPRQSGAKEKPVHFNSHLPSR